ncbi:LOW QUALITY PROTEIN: phospholipase D1-like [Babylonia areolata]|uniref:LOW QUALITY PROTEIN: phospholipase D1-like n=1 Tax=Babylonia areolata TaxID=304850 RepID=UPI003FD3CA9E
MSSGEGPSARVRDTTRDFLRSFSVVDYDSEDEFDELSPIPETPADQIDGALHEKGLDLGEQIIPFKSIFAPAGAYTSTKRNFWLPKQLVQVKITDFFRQELKVLNPNLYKIEVKHGEHEWVVHRRYKHFRQLHDALAMFRARYRIPFPRTGGGRERQKTLKREWQKQESVRLPLRPEALISEDDIPHRMKQLEKYLQNLLLCKSYRNHPETLKFFEVSHLSFVARLGNKAKEGMVKKCSGGRRISIGCCGCLQKVHFAGTWNKRWLVLKDSYLAYIRPEDGVISDVMLMDQEFKVESGMKATGAKHGVLISNLNRNLLVKCWTSRKAREWAESIQKMASQEASDFTTKNRFGSFAPVREDSYARWFVDARSYFEAVAEALEKAKEEIYITDWWLSPEIYMKRPMVDGDHWRLDVILERKASQGVRVFILLYKEIEAALMIKSIYSKQVLMGKHENIKVLRHPDHIPGKGILLWAHHEKLVAIDQQIAFVGGIDLCYGRWDDAQHRLTDMGSIVLNSPPSPAAVSRQEESHVTDFTELTEDLRSVDSPASLRPPQSNSPAISKTSKAVAAAGTPAATAAAGKPVMGVSTQDVNVKSFPPSPQQRAGESSDTGEGTVPSQGDGDIIMPQEASHVYAHVVLNSEETSATDGGIGESSTEAPVTEQPPSKHTDLSEAGKSVSVDSTTSTGSGKRHLWGEGGRSKLLKLKIPSQSSTESEPPKTDSKPTGDDVDRLQVSPQPDLHHQSNNGHLRSNSEVSNVSKTSDTELITKEEAPTMHRPPPQSATQSSAVGGNRDTLDFRGAVSVMKVLGRKARQEENNNQGQNSEDPSTVARRRWRMVFNVQKFESTVRHSQVPERIPAELLLPPSADKKKKHGSQSFYHKMENKFKGMRRGSFDLSRIEMKNQAEDAETGVYRTHSEQDILERGLQGATRLWIGKDYVNFIHKDFVGLENPFEDFIDRSQTPRMPWHDIGAMVYGKAARDVSRHFIGRWNFTKLTKYKRKTVFPLLLPKNYPKMHIPQTIKDLTFDVETQVLRSLCGWSSGIETVEKSIQEAYEFCIESAKNYIYIENQFFITQVDDLSTVSNCIGTALYKRILRAHRNDEDFKVYVMMPLLPAFEGEFGTTSGVAIQAITHWNFASICRGGNSLIEKLARSEVPDPQKYIVFGGLRTWDKLNGKLVSELIYIHSKLMIVDDNTVILGSANINDRSMLGKRDSEMAIIFRDKKKEKINLNGHFLTPGPFASSIRHTLFREHLGLTEGKEDVDLRDISTDSFYKNVWIRQAAVNTSIYDKVFRCLPTDQVLTFQQLRDYNANPNLATSNPEEALTQLAKVKGHLVLMPLQFLKEESLAPKMGQKEALLPSYLWT